MNTAAPYRRQARLLLWLGLFLTVGVLAGCGPKPAPATAAVKPVVAGTNTNAVVAASTNLANQYVSVFEDLPPQKGKDPFFPTSHRRDPRAETTVASPTAPVDPVLVLKGIVHTAKHSQAVINTETFEVGETETIKVPNGKVVVKCLEISSNYVIVQVEGEAEPTRLVMEPRKNPESHP